MKKMLISFLVMIVGLWCLMVALLWFMRDPLIYRFDQVNSVLAPPDGWASWVLHGESLRPVVADEEMSDAKTWMWRFNSDAENHILVFVGNVGRLNDGVFSARPFYERGYGVTVLAYPGASGAPGSPDQEDIVARGVKLAGALARETGRVPGFYGISMGGAVATITASRFAPEFLVLEAPLADIWAIARASYPFIPPYMPDVDMWQSIKVADQVRVPALVVHGGRDGVVPVTQGEALAKALEGEFIRIDEGGHNDLARWGVRKHVGEFIDSVLPATP